MIMVVSSIMMIYVRMDVKIQHMEQYANNILFHVPVNDEIVIKMVYVTI